MTATFDKIARNNLISNFNEKDFAYDGTPINQMEVKLIQNDLAREMISTFHYSKTFPDSTLFAYGGYLNGKLIGVICYGMGCGKNQYTAIVPNIENGTYLELTRLWVANDMPRNSESKLISTSLKMLPKKYHLIISFADELQGHCGKIYQATNWYYLGVNSGGKMLINNKGIKKHPRLLGIYRMRHPEYNNLTNEELMKLLGYEWCESGKKHRYVYLRGTKKEKKAIYIYIYNRIQPYPKIDKKKGLSEKEIIESADIKYKQIKLF